MLIPRLKVEEGLRLQAYPDPVSGGAPWTIGYGHTGLYSDDPIRAIEEGDTCDIAQAEAWLEEDVKVAMHHLDVGFPSWRELDDVRQDVLVDMCFNLGWGTLCTFKRFLAALKARDFEGAAREMLWNIPPNMGATPPFKGIPTRWAKQVGGRADRLAYLLRYGLSASQKKVLADVG